MSARQCVSVWLCFVVAIPVLAQEKPVVYQAGSKGSYRPASVPPPSYGNSPRAASLIRAGNIYLSLQDAIALALENNLDIELQRYGVSLAATDTKRAQGGGVVRGVPLTVNEVPAGIGGPGSPLITTAATGVTPQTSIPVNITDTQLIQQGQGNLNVNGTLPYATGPAVPLFDPTVLATVSGAHQTTPQTSLTSTGTGTLTQNIANWSTSYQQGFSYGTQVTGGFQSQVAGTNSLRSLYNPYYGSALGITVTQPLLRGYGKELNQRYIRIARNSEKITESIFRQQVISTVSGVIRLYNDLVSLNEDYRVKRQTLTTAERLVEDNKNKVDQGTLAPIELKRAQAQSAASRQDTITTEGYVRQQELILKNMLFRNGIGDPLIHDVRIVATDPIQVEDLPALPPQEMVAQALENRPEVLAARLQVVNSGISLKGTRNLLLPQLDIVANAQNSGLAGVLNKNPGNTATLNAGGQYGNYANAIGQIFLRDYPTYSVGVNLTLPVRNRVAQADAARDEIQLRQAEIRRKQLENQIRLEVEDAIIALQRTRSALDAAAETRKLQEESLSIEQEKFGVGLSTNFLVIQYQGYLAQARSTEVGARSAYVKAKVQLERALGKTLENNNVQIDEAMKGTVSRQPSALPAAN